MQLLRAYSRSAQVYVYIRTSPPCSSRRVLREQRANSHCTLVAYVYMRMQLLRACIRGHAHAATARWYTYTYACSCCALTPAARSYKYVYIRMQLLPRLHSCCAACMRVYVYMRMQPLRACMRAHTHAAAARLV